MHNAIIVVSVILFIDLIICIIKGIIKNDPTLIFMGFILLALAVVTTPLYLKSDTSTEVNASAESEIEENIESTTMEYINSPNQGNVQLMINEERTDAESAVANAISDVVEKGNVLPLWEIGYYVFLSLMSILFIVLFCLPGPQDTSEEINTNEDNTKTTPRGTRKNRENSIKIDDIDFCRLAEKNQKLSYIVWAIEYLNSNGRQDHTRKLSNYYIPEIISAYKQYRKVKSLNEKEMTAEAKQHYEKIVDLSYRVAKAEINKAAEEIVTDMDCNAKVCESIYKKRRI